ncbi:MAG TPA: hypothetical protein VM691_06445 [Myxococcales bacterium]|nr:hypothetical protein [Myxococcales bacterium]
MKNMNQGHDDRMQLICRVQVAYDDLRATRQEAAGSRRAMLAMAAAKRKFSLLNRALAVMALQAA